MGRKNLALGLGAGAAVAAVLYVATRAKAGEEEEEKEEGKGISFTLWLTNIPEYASAANEWTVNYGGKYHGKMTPIGEPILVEDVPTSGQLVATITGGPFDTWQFRTMRTFRDGGEYRFNLGDGIIEGPGIALKDLIVEPDYVTVGEEISISVTVINEGNLSESGDVFFCIQRYEDSAPVGDPIMDSTAVSLAPGTSKPVSIKITPEAGRYLVSVDGLHHWLDVLEPYPDIPNPKVEYLEWTAGGIETTFSEAGFEPWFQGTILLPQPGKNQYYLFNPDLGGEDLWQGIGDYLGDGRWEIKGESILPYQYPDKFVCYWKNYYAWIGVEPPNWTEAIPTYTSRIPCMGTKLNLTLVVELWESYVSGVYTDFRKVKGWKLDTGLTFVVDIRM
jgi:hypothetical protein